MRSACDTWTLQAWAPPGKSRAGLRRIGLHEGPVVSWGQTRCTGRDQKWGSVIQGLGQSCGASAERGLASTKHGLHPQLGCLHLQQLSAGARVVGGREKEAPGGAVCEQVGSSPEKLGALQSR